MNEARRELVQHKMNELVETRNEEGKYRQPFKKYIFMTTAPLGIAGLLAVKMMDKNGLPAVVLNDSPVYDKNLGEKVYKGSVRCPHTYQFLSNVNQSGMAYCAGHECECGISVIVDKLHLFLISCHMNLMEGFMRKIVVISVKTEKLSWTSLTYIWILTAIYLILRMMGNVSLMTSRSMLHMEKTLNCRTSY